MSLWLDCSYILIFVSLGKEMTDILQMLESRTGTCHCYDCKEGKKMNSMVNTIRFEDV